MAGKNSGKGYGYDFDLAFDASRSRLLAFPWLAPQRKPSTLENRRDPAPPPRAINRLILRKTVVPR